VVSLLTPGEHSFLQCYDLRQLPPELSTCLDPFDKVELLEFKNCGVQPFVFNQRLCKSTRALYPSTTVQADLANSSE
jgi:hypothetical protein